MRMTTMNIGAICGMGKLKIMHSTLTTGFQSGKKERGAPFLLGLFLIFQKALGDSCLCLSH